MDDVFACFLFGLCRYYLLSARTTMVYHPLVIS
jgi:hypothetical protein